MKQKLVIFTTVFLILSSWAFGQELNENYPITIAIVGTASYNDVNLILKNLKRSQQINRLTISLSSKGLVELSGTFHGVKESLIEEISGLAQDRFTVEVQKQKGKQTTPSLSITLRKIAPQTGPS